MPLLGDALSGEGDAMRDGLAAQNAVRDFDGFLSAGRVDERGGEFPVSNRLPSAVQAGKAIDTDELHLLVASLGLGSQESPNRHGIVVRVHEIDVRVRL